MYPADPAGAVPGGIDTFIRGVLRWAPDDIDFDLVGATTDAIQRPVGKWTRCDVGGKEYGFYPIMVLNSPGVQSRIPASLVYTARLWLSRVHRKANVLEFHELEPSLALLGDKRPKTAVIHTDMQVALESGSGIRWRFAPGLYFALERFLMRRMDCLYCVRDSAVNNYKSRFPAIAERIRFTPTWVDLEVFNPGTEGMRTSDRRDLCNEFGFSDHNRILITVGRISQEKNPQLLIEAFDIARKSNPEIRLLIVGEGELRPEVEALISSKGLNGQVVPCGIRDPATVSKYLRGSDVFVLSSNYEGMPMCVLEALGTGLPVVTTDVGEVRLIVRPGVNGAIVGINDAQALASAIDQCLAKSDVYRGGPCTSAVSEFTPQKVLEPIYENYRALARQCEGPSSG